jgi:DNA repair exonuclease SbcCD nuclease subunit
VAPGNHDWLGPESLYVRVRWSPNVHIFNENQLKPLALTEGFTVWGGAHRAPRGTDDFLDGFHVDRSGFNLAVFHGSERSCLPFQEEGKIAHAPFNATQITAAGLDFALCGHYHVPRCETHYLYPGNPDPLSFGEQGTRGPVVVEFGSNAIVSCRTVVLASTTVFDLTVDVTGCTSGFAVRERVKRSLEGHRGIARVTVEGELGTDVDVTLSDLAGCAPWMDGVLPRFGEIHLAIDIDALMGQPTVEGRFAGDVMASNLSDDEKRRVLTTGLRALRGRDDLDVL